MKELQETINLRQVNSILYCYKIVSTDSNKNTEEVSLSRIGRLCNSYVSKRSEVELLNIKNSLIFYPVTEFEELKSIYDKYKLFFNYGSCIYIPKAKRKHIMKRRYVYEFYYIEVRETILSYLQHTGQIRAYENIKQYFNNVSSKNIPYDILLEMKARELLSLDLEEYFKDNKRRAGK